MFAGASLGASRGHHIVEPQVKYQVSRNLPGMIASSAVGALIWGWVALHGGRAEPWDAPEFWSFGYPAALLACVALGLVFPDRAWRWGLVVFAMLAVVMAGGAIRVGSGVSMLPPGLVLLGVLALPGIGLAALAGRVRRK
jgi:hypothetical protein